MELFSGVNFMGNRDEILERMREAELLVKNVRDGKKISCPECGEELYFAEPGSGRLPGVYCGNECTQIILNMSVKQE